MRRLLLLGLVAASLATAPRAQDVGGDLYVVQAGDTLYRCLLYTSPSPRD